MHWPSDALKLAALPPAASDEHFELHLAAVEHGLAAPILIQSRADVLSAVHWQEQIEPYEHQMRNLITFCRRAPVALIADDVGLGKTISAGLILNELQVRKKVRRALVLCPTVLIEQWAEELASKFGMARIATGTGQDFADNLRSSAAVVITTYETARDRIRDVARAGFDMVVLDEAHKLRNLTGGDEPPKLARAVFEALQQRAFRYVLMLTATPVQNRVWDIYSLVACLAAAKGHANPLGDEAAFRRRYLTDKEGRKLVDGRRDEFRQHLQEYMVRTSRLTAGLSFPQRMLQTFLVAPQPHETELYERVGRAIAGLPRLAQFSIAEALLSSPRALHKQLGNMVDKGTLRPEVLQQLGPALAAVGPGCKLGHVLELCAELARREPRTWRCLVFTRRTETQELLAEALRRQGIAVGLIRGGEADANRKAIAAYRADPPTAHVLVSTDAGAVGLNLQAGNVIVNYDLPWNPMVLEQRIGRVQRIGSKFAHVLVWNLAVDGTVEGLIVARLVEKLHAVAQTLGEVEGVLEAANREDEFADDVGELVTQALMGADVQRALAKAQESIERARQLYAAEQEAVEEHLGRLDAMHDAGPKAPQLAPLAPRLSAADFCRRAFVAAGGAVEADGPMRARVRLPGRAPWTAVFDGDDPLLADGAARLGEAAVRLYEPGSQDFERLAAEWRKQSAQRVRDLAEAARAAIPAALAQWAAGLGAPAQAVAHAIRREQPTFAGEVVVRAAATIAHDRYEKLVAVAVADPAHGDVPPAVARAPAAVLADFRPQQVAAIAPAALQAAIAADRDLAEFARFYAARSAEEVAKAGPGAPAQEDVRQRFAVAASGELVGARGVQHLVATVQAEFQFAGAPRRYPVELTLVPLTGRVLAEPPRSRCAVTGASVPETWLQACAVSQTRALAHELAACGVTNAPVLPAHLATSAVSGRRFRADEAAASAVSGKQGHRSELVRCEASGSWLLPDEAQRSSCSNRLVDRRLLQPSERDASRRGTADEFVICAATGKRLLRDEASASAVSGQIVDRDLLVVSAASGRAALPAETVRCAATGAVLLPDEAARSDHGGQLVDVRHLVRSAVSGRRALAAEMGRCEVTGVAALPDELAVSDVSGKRVRRDALVACAVTGRRLLRDEAVASAFSGRLLDPAVAVASAASGRLGAPDEVVACAVTGARLLPDETAVCAATGERVDARLCVPCAATGRLLRRDRAVRSDSGRLGHPDALQRCAWTGASLLVDELFECPLTRVRVSRSFGGAWAAAPLVALAAGAPPTAVPADADAAALAAALAEAGHKVRGLRLARGPGGAATAFFADASTFFGLRKKHVLGWARRDGDRWTLLATAVGRAEEGGWAAD
jgi:superfamily II DNA or RNA helicase